MYKSIKDSQKRKKIYIPFWQRFDQIRNLRLVPRLLPLPLNSDTKNSSNFFPFLLVQLLLMYGFRTIKNNDKRIREKYIYLINEKEWEAWTIQQTQIFFRRRKKEGVFESRSFSAFFVVFVFFVPSHSSGFWVLHSSFTNWINNSCVN